MIPVNEPKFEDRELAYVTECIRSGWVSSAGPFLDRFERMWAAYCGRRHGIAVANGTVALQLAFACLDLQPGDEVILPAFTIISCAQAVFYNGATPVLVDADPQTWCIDVSQIEAAITSRTRAILPVHMYGHPVDMDPLLELAQRYHLAVIEDAAEAHGAEYDSHLSLRRDPASVPPAFSSPSSSWRRCGSFGEMSCFSFYANKAITTGEGGMILTDDDHLAEKARWMRNLCFGTEERFRHERLGFNFRMTNLQAALGVAQIERIDTIVARKRAIGQAYRQQLGDLEGIELPVEKPWAKNIYWMFGIVLKEETGFDARSFAKELAARGIETRPFFKGIHEQPAFRKCGLFVNQSYPVTERLSRQGLYLPSGLALQEDQIQTAVQAIREILK